MTKIMRPLHIFALFAFFVSSIGNAVAPNTVVATINTGVNPAALAITPDGMFAYVPNNNNYGIAGQDSVSVLNLDSNLLVQTIHDNSFNEPYTVTINADGTLAYVTNSDGTTISMINIANNMVVGVIDGFDGPSGMVISPNGITAYVNNYGGSEGVGSGNGTTVSVVNLMTNTITATITVGQAPASLAISPDGAFVYTINYVDGNPGTGTMSIIRTSDNRVMGTIPGFSGPFRIALTPDGLFAYVTDFGSNNFAPFGTTVSVVDLTKNMITDTVMVGIQPAGVAISPDGRFAYVTNYNTLYAGSNFTKLTAGQGTVNIIDTATNQVVPPTIAVDQGPANIAISPNGEFAYVSNYTSNVVNVIALQSFQIIGKGCKIKVKKHDDKKEIANKLTWRATGSSLPVWYAIFRQGLNEPVAVIPASHKVEEYIDYDVQPKKEYIYYIVGLNSAGTASEPVEIVVTKACKK